MRLSYNKVLFRWSDSGSKGHGLSILFLLKDFFNFSIYFLNVYVNSVFLWHANFVSKLCKSMIFLWPESFEAFRWVSYFWIIILNYIWKNIINLQNARRYIYILLVFHVVNSDTLALWLSLALSFSVYTWKSVLSLPHFHDCSLFYLKVTYRY